MHHQISGINTIEFIQTLCKIRKKTNGKNEPKEYDTEYEKIRYIDYNESNKITIFYIYDLGCCGTSDYTLKTQSQLLANLITDIGLGEIVLYGYSMGKTIILSEQTIDNGGGIFSREIANNSLEYPCNLQYDLIIKKE